MDCASTGGTAPAVLNAAHEVAVWKFLHGQIGYNTIYDCAAPPWTAYTARTTPSWTLYSRQLGGAEIC